MGVPPYVVAPAAGVAPAASRVIKAGQCSAFQLNAYNSNASARYLHVFDAASQPGNGATPLCPPVQVPSGSTGSIDFGVYGRPFTTGVVLVLSTTDTTLTAAGADGMFDGTTYP